MNTKLGNIDQLLTTIKDQTAQSNPNRLIIAQAVDDAQRVFEQIQAEAAQLQSLASPAAKLQTGLTIGDGFRFGIGFYLGVLLMGISVVIIVFIIIAILGLVSLDGLITTLGHL